MIPAAEGFARAVDTEILRGTDIRVAGESANFGVTEVRHDMKVMMSQDAAEGPRAFLEKRKPVFSGRGARARRVARFAAATTVCARKK